MRESASDLSRRLAENAESVCRRYLSNGRREGRYWSVGDLANTPGRSLYVRLYGSTDGRLAAGKWTDAATGDHGDLLDLIGAVQRHSTLSETLEEARRFLGVEVSRPTIHGPHRPATSAAQRLFAAARPIGGTFAETYLRHRCLAVPDDIDALRFHPRCFHRPSLDAPSETWPAMLAAITDEIGRIMGVHRTWLDREGSSKAPLATPRRALGQVLGGAVQFGRANDRLIVGEGIETVLSIRTVLHLPTAAALSAAHLAAFSIPAGLRRLYIVRDNDPAGVRATEALRERATLSGVEALVLSPRMKDANDDLRAYGPHALAAHLRPQLAPEDTDRLIPPEADDTRGRRRPQVAGSSITPG